MEPKFSKGQLVRLVNTDKQGVIIEEPKVLTDEIHYVLFIENSQKTYSEESLEAVESLDNDVIGSLKQGTFASATDFLNYLTYVKIERPLSNNLYAFLSSRTELLIHQFKPILKFLSSPYQRLLIADEVGVGKTIEAGIIYTELLSRQVMRNVLIICPSSLRYKWQKEMSKRFGEDFGILDSTTLKVFLQKFERSPNSQYLKAIASIQMLRSEEFINQFDRLQIPWDMVLIDEAHHLRNENTKSNNLGRALSTTADNFIMMSATPLQLGNRDLFNLFKIMLPEEYSSFDTFEEQVKPNEYLNAAIAKVSKGDSPKDILNQLREVESTSQKERFLENPNYTKSVKILVENNTLSHQQRVTLHRRLSDLNILGNIYTRTKKKEISIESPIREPKTINVTLTDEEMQFYQKVTELILRLNPGVPPGFLLQMPLRQVASCIPAAIDYLKNIKANGMIAIEEGEDDIEEMTDTYKLSDAEIGLIDETIRFAEENLTLPDTKTQIFIKTIGEIFQDKPDNKLIIFSFFKKTLRYLEKQLRSKGLKVVRIDGDVPFIERETIFSDFAKPEGPQILLSSEVGGEGLDMQFCNCMMNYDLPWNPMRVEQRIGRLDRYGQKSPKIHIYNFSVEGTIESNIFLRLCNRIGVFEQYVGELEPILGEAIKELTGQILNPNLTPEQQKEKTDQIALVLEKKKVELEAFDNDRQKFLGQDDYFTEQISDIQKEEKFVTPEEIKNLIAQFLKNQFPKSSIKKSDKGSEIYALKPCIELQEFLRNSIISNASLSTNFTENFLELIDRESFRITFDYKEANSDPSVEFITLRHPLVKSIISYYDKRPLNISANLECNGEHPGDYIFFIYLLDIKSYTKSLTFIPIVVDRKSKTIQKEMSSELFNFLKNSSDMAKRNDSIDEDFVTLEDVALQHIVKEKKYRENELKEVNESLINDRLSSLKQTHEFRLRNIDQMINRLKENMTEKSAKVIKMKESQKNNLQRNYEQKKEKLETEKNIIVSYELIAGGLLNVKSG